MIFQILFLFKVLRNGNDIRDIEGLSSSKSKLEKYPTLDDFAVRGTTEFLDDISEENLNKMLDYSEMRIINNPNTSDHFIQHQWDGRIFLVNSGGSHHFAAARYIAKKLKKEVAITGRLERYTFNQPLIIRSAFAGIDGVIMA